jgi:glutamate-1-semialdehyde 2,1-aminomutase
LIQELYNRAKILIPGGNSLLSKRPEMYLPNGSSTYFESTCRIEIKDIEGRIFKDFSIMGVGTNVLGYSNEQVDSAVMEVVRKGNLSSLNCAE